MCALTIATGVPTTALAHDASVSTMQGHLEEDSVAPLSPYKQRRLDRYTLAASATDAATAAASVTGNEGQVGQWGPVVDWPVVAVHVALLRNGKVLAYDSLGDKATETYPVQDYTRATVWDPASGTQTPVNVNTGFNIFCSGLAHLMDGSLFVAGGNKNAPRGHRPDPHLRPQLQQLESRAQHVGGPLVPERYSPEQRRDADHRRASRHARGAQDRRGPAHARHGLARSPALSLDGRSARWPCFLLGSRPDDAEPRHRRGRHWQSFGQRDTYARDYGSHALYDVGKILVAGGGGSLNDARVIDLNGSTPQVSSTSPMATGRRQFNLTVLADGSVLATGGNSSGARWWISTTAFTRPSSGIRRPGNGRRSRRSR